MQTVGARPSQATVDRAALASGATIAAIVFARVAFGAWLLIFEAWEKITTWNAHTLPTIFGIFTKSPLAYGFYKSFLLNMALPNAAFLRGLITGWETVFALCLIIGLGLRVLIPLQLFANLNYILAKTWGTGGANLDRLTIIILVTMFLVSAGRYYGLDGYLRRRFPRLHWL